MPAPDRAALQTVLTMRFGRRLERLEPLAEGAWSQAWAVRQGARELVVRWSELEEDFRSDERASGYASAALPVPRMLEIGPALGGWYAITERRHGTVLEDRDAAGMTAVLPSLLATLDALRTADIADTRGFGGWDRSGNGSHPTWASTLLAIGLDAPGGRIHGWRERLATTPDAERVFDAAYSRLVELAPTLPEARHLVHSDLLNRNVLVEDDRITAVLDWGSAIYGDFLFDVAWFDFWGPWYERWREVDITAAAIAHLEASGVAIPDRDSRLHACALYIGLDGLSYQAWRGDERPLRWTVNRLAEVLDQGPQRMPVS